MHLACQQLWPLQKDAKIACFRSFFGKTSVPQALGFCGRCYHFDSAQKSQWRQSARFALASPSARLYCTFCNPGGTHLDHPLLRN